jgi:hypothetical protein
MRELLSSQVAANRKDKMRIYKMTLEEIEIRRRFLRNQARYLIRAENDQKIKRALIKIRNVYVGRIGKRFEPNLSQKLDCLNWLIEN